MKKKLCILSISLIIILSVIFSLNTEVTIKQGINRKVSTIKIPLYLKILDFFDRHYNYKLLVNRILQNSKTEKEKIVKLFEWTHSHIKKMPEGFPVVDDHVWHIIVRGYGARDQSQDVFTTLCSYAGANAFFDRVYERNQVFSMPLSLVKLNNAWRVFDTYNGVYFVNSSGEIATINEIKKGDWQLKKITQSSMTAVDYEAYLANLPSIKEVDYQRANIQSPLKRLIYEIRKWMTPDKVKVKIFSHIYVSYTELKLAVTSPDKIIYKIFV
ncbi:MAG: transglutaminase domain-containing protein [Candidatus Omnitrophica bacterium]|nr:transglutaminase domain-containing protein [Candidatus Omnitrophota bacterium]